MLTYTKRPRSTRAACTRCPFGENLGEAFAKAQLSGGTPLPDKGCVFISINDRYKPEAADVARRLAEFGFELVPARGTVAAPEGPSGSVENEKCQTIPIWH